MANEYRSPLDYRFGTITVAAAISDLTLTSAEFATLPSTYTTSIYAPLVLHDPATQIYEVVWVTAHTAASTTVTVVRGKESSTARAWPSSTQWLIAPTIRDALLVVASTATLPSDANVGQRAVQTDTGDAWSKTKNQGWQSWPASRAADVISNGVAIPAGNRPIIKAIAANATTNGSGAVLFTFPGGAFPTAVLVAVAQVVYGSAGGILTAKLENLALTDATFSFYAGTSVVASTAVVAHIIAIGY